MKRSIFAAFASALALATAAAPLATAQNYQGGPPDGNNHNRPAHVVVVRPPAQHVVVVRQPPQHVVIVRQPPPRVVIVRPPAQHVVIVTRSWHQGDRFDGSRRVVDWHRYRYAHQPPQGYEWVQDGNNLVLIAITTGVVASFLANAAYQ